ncbi:dephospho-CoA kinase [Candidatus Pelagibacter sp.]|nr:dephospho-CoA kinase [Candidatus Pelagibacter sp.]|tara:strand:+ start:278 stop:847 length:570 start_codon:yes stop_codon:yes gene_type:complete
MIRIGILGDIGSGKSYVAQNFGYPVFNADQEVAKLYKKDKKIFDKLKKILPNHFHSFPVQKKEILSAILSNKNNLTKIVEIIHSEIRKKMNFFLKKYKKSKIVILDIPLLLENKINNREDILIYVQSKESKILERLKKRKNFNRTLLNKFRVIQLPISYKKRKSDYIIKNDFTKKSVTNAIKNILKKII